MSNILLRVDSDFGEVINSNIKKIAEEYIGKEISDEIISELKDKVTDYLRTENKLPKELDIKFRMISNKLGVIIFIQINRLADIKVVNLLYSSPIYFIANGIRYSHYNHNKSDSDIKRCDGDYICPICKASFKYDPERFNMEDQLYKCPNCSSYVELIPCCDQYNIGTKDYSLIKRVGFHLNHESVLEHSLLIFDITMSTKALLEESRHRIGVSQTVASSRYSLESVELLFESTNNDTLDFIQEKYKDSIQNVIYDLFDEEKSVDYTMDQVAMLLPQSFMYRLQLSFNLRSLKHFLELRLHKSAHKTIRKVAVGIMEELEKNANKYFKLLIEDKKIKSAYEARYNDELRGNKSTVIK